MAQTKRKRRTKHRGNAAGMVEARGRTSRGTRLSPAEQKKADRVSAREARLNRPPSWNSAFFKAGLMAALLFVFVQLGVLGSKASISEALFICLVALVVYTPLAYVTDKFVYSRAQKRRRAKQA